MAQTYPLPFYEEQLYIPQSLEELVQPLQKALKNNYDSSSVEIVSNCPDLSQAPFKLAAQGLSGNPIIVDAGGSHNINYIENNQVKFDIKEIAKDLGREDDLIIGPGAASNSCVGRNAELMINAMGSSYQSRYTYVQEDSKTHEEIFCSADYPHSQTGPLCNLLISKGITGPVLKICARGEKNLNFVSCIRKALAEAFPEKAIGLGGVMHISAGTIRTHVMKDFLGRDLLCQKDVDEDFLRFWPMKAPMICVSVLISNDLHNSDWRLEHTHFWSEGNEGGHYHYAVEPKNEACYEAYYTLAGTAFRLGIPTVSQERKEKNLLFK